MKTATTENATLQAWKVQWNEFFVEQSDLEMDRVGRDFLRTESMKMDVVFAELHHLSLIFSKMDMTQKLSPDSAPVFGKGFKYEKFYKNGDKSIVKWLTENSHFQLIQLVLPREKPIVFPFNSFDLTMCTFYHATLNGNNTYEFQIALNGLSPEALEFKYLSY